MYHQQTSERILLVCLLFHPPLASLNNAILTLDITMMFQMLQMLQMDNTAGAILFAGRIGIIVCFHVRCIPNGLIIHAHLKHRAKFKTIIRRTRSICTLQIYVSN
ncbi:hypothetical protein BJV82DRAFT_63476 [Fennellomyces sp. T-0311]|nr:hypothetical protein BJV82DRAFT_63476 [Fennellomyces sp. T-0311]